MSSAAKILRRVLFSLIALAAVLAAVAMFALGPIVRQAAERVGPAILGVPIQVESVRIHLLRGSARIDGLVVGAPSGFSASLVEMNHFRMKLRLSSLMSDPLVLEEVVVSGPTVTYELAGARSNVGALLAALGDGEKESSSPKKETSGKKVVIEHFLFEDGRVRLATTLTGGKGVVLPLPRIELRGIGREQEGVTTLDAIRETVGVVSIAVLTTVRDGVIGVAGLGADAVAAISGAAGAGLESAGALAGATLRSLGGLATDGTKAIGDAAGEGFKKVGGALRSVGGLFGERTNPEPGKTSD